MTVSSVESLGRFVLKEQQQVWQREGDDKVAFSRQTIALSQFSRLKVRLLLDRLIA
jgi:hypothetical protein